MNSNRDPLYSPTPTAKMTQMLLDKDAQLLGLVSNHNHSPIRMEDVVPRFMSKERWRKALRCALKKGYLERTEGADRKYTQGYLPEALAFNHHYWMAFNGIDLGLGEAVAMHYTHTALELLALKQIWPSEALRSTIGCPENLWHEIEYTLEYDVPFVDGPFAPENVFCHIDGGTALYETMLSELIPVPDDYLYNFQGGDMA